MALVGHPSPEKEWSLAKKIDAIAAAGFDGITTRLTPDHQRFAETAGLRHLLGVISTDDPAEFADRVREQKNAGFLHINVQMDNHDTPPALATKHWLAMVRAAEKIVDVVVSLEMHRDCCTETPQKIDEIAERYHRATGELIELNFNFSHIASVKHLNPSNYVARLFDHLALVQRSEQIHLRPFNGNHCQVPVTYRGALTPEVKSYLVFVEATMKLWKQARANENKTLFACPEIGPDRPGGACYNITGLPPAWPDAVVLRGELAATWKRV